MVVPSRLLSVLRPALALGVVTVTPLLAAGLLVAVAANAGRVKAALSAVRATIRRVNEFNANIEDS